MNKEEIRKILAAITPGTIAEAQKVVRFIVGRIEQEDDPIEGDSAKGAFIAAYLIEYGKLKARKEEVKE